MDYIDELNSDKFNLSLFLKARETCQLISKKIISKVEVGMTEKDGLMLIKDEFAREGITKFWHPSKFRISADTLKTFKDLSDPSLKTTLQDLCFIDVGPIIDEHEADYGETFIVGSTLKHDLMKACENVFSQTSSLWREKKISGNELYVEAQKFAKEHGCELDPHMSGHRLGDFPHHLHSKKSLNQINHTPSPHVWVLEVHLLNPQLNRGAFMEDILI